MDEEPNLQKLTFEQQAFLKQQMEERAAKAMEWLDNALRTAPPLANMESFQIIATLMYDDGHNIHVCCNGTLKQCD